MGIDRADLWYYALLAGVMVAIVFIVVEFIRPALGDEYKDMGSSIIVGVLIALAVVFMGMIRNRRAANTERMVKALYDHFGLGDDGAPSGGRCDKCGRGGSSSGGGDTKAYGKDALRGG